MQRARDKLFLMQTTMAAGPSSSSDKGPTGVSERVSSGKVSRSDAIQLLQFGVAGAISAQNSGDDPAVTSPQVATLLREVEEALEKGQPSLTVGVGGRMPSAPASAEALAAAASALSGAKEVVEMAPPEEVQADLDTLGRGSRERASRFIKVGRPRTSCSSQPSAPIPTPTAPSLPSTSAPPTHPKAHPVWCTAGW